MNLYTFSLITTTLFSATAMAQYAPQAGVAGSTAIHSSSPQFKSWANNCHVYRGWIDIAQPSLGLVTSGDSSMAVGPANFSVVSLGDSGVAVLTFPKPIVNGPGFDFAVFENGFPDPMDSKRAFLELAHVEVSSDGINFFRFPSASETQTTTQVAGAGVYMDAQEINNLAGKYMSNYGTPFDLEEMKEIPGLDVNNVTHVRLVDVVGSITGHSSYDASNRIINDPYPTNFPIGGFDLDAVGVLNQSTLSINTTSTSVSVNTFPNPVSDVLTVAASQPVRLTLKDISGKLIWHHAAASKATFSMQGYSSGLYFLTFKDDNGYQWVERIVKQ